jgi:L-ascorbate metabolism protein UlaG (beta-lactamase superfamily)
MPDISYLGHGCFRLKGREGTVICDPFDRSTGLDMGRPTAHIVTVSHSHPAHNHTQVIRALGDRDSVFVIDGPGEYEVRGVLITGVRTRHNHSAAARPFNTVYVIHLDDVVFCHLGSLGHELTQSQLEEIGNVDVLFIPVGGGATIGPADASNVITQIDPRMVVPMQYAQPGLTVEQPPEPLDKFVHEVGLQDAAPQEKVTVTQASLPAEDDHTRIVVMLAGTT